MVDEKILQAVAVKSDSHLETLKVVAVASALKIAEHEHSKIFKEWLETDYRKTVRKISKPSQFNFLKSLPDCCL